MDTEHDPSDPGGVSVNAVCWPCGKPLNVRWPPPEELYLPVEILPCPDCYPRSTAQGLENQRIQYYERL